MHRLQRPISLTISLRVVHFLSFSSTLAYTQLHPVYRTYTMSDSTITATPHKQHPLGTGFTAASTASDVIAGIELTGKNVIVTGGNAGLGLETTRTLAKAGAHVTVAARDIQRAELAVADIDGVECSQLDLIDPHSIDAFVSRWLLSNRPLHILINNASPSSSLQLERDVRGFEPHFATSHLGHFQLTCGLLPALRSANGARVVNVSSGAQRMSDIRWDDPNFATGYTSQAAYAQAKKANVLHAVELDRRWAQYLIRAYAVHPGVIIHKKQYATRTTDSLRAMGLLDDNDQPIINPTAGKKTMAQGISTIVFAATSPLLDNVGGVYLKDNDISVIDDTVQPMTAERIVSEVMSSSIDPESARRLWELSERLLSVSI